ncbi:MAG TPA: BREX-1 system phosphatase PglZ type A [Clostridiales bacterium]|nr:MAG: TIGR02687 family protein [Clostridiales bacterium GWD2_32_19]HCC06806.1 BREX-1 system phosphatase PglZ type A [Clostridiales bacterium]
MDLKSIQDKLNNEFKGTERKLVFWYDDNAEFAEEVDSLVLDNAKMYKLDANNVFYTKYFLEIVDKDTSYLVYAPFAKPADRDNHLTDTIYYSKVFYADKISLMMNDLGIPEKYKEQLNKYPKFFKSRSEKKYVEPFMALSIENYNSEIIVIGMLAVLCNIKTPNFDEVLRALIIAGDFENNKYMAEFERIGVNKEFWTLCQKYYGYSEEKPTLEKLVITMLITYTEGHFDGVLPKAWTYFISNKKHDITVFVSNLMNNMLYKDRYMEIAQYISIKIKAKESMSKCEIAQLKNCDTFETFDELIMDNILSKLTYEFINTGEFEKIYDIAEDRKEMYYGKKLEYEYSTIMNGWALLKWGSNAIFGQDTVLDEYIKQHCLLDMFYRKFYWSFDKLEDNSRFIELKKYVENVYTNAVLAKEATSWSDMLEKCTSLASIKLEKQHNFYNSYVKSSMKKGCTVVIISDAFRYECAVELNGRLMDDLGYTTELNAMMSSVPSYTKLGMAALLPHTSLSFTDEYDVMIDGMPTVSTEQRQKVLETYTKESIACTYTDIMALDRDGVRNLLNGKELVYIYHNQVDARGDNLSTENEIFDACEEAMAEITKVIKKLTVDKSITNYIITADHGFIYKRDKLMESDKVNIGKLKGYYVNKRFMLAKDVDYIDNTLNFSLDYIDSTMKGICVTTPRGVDIFKVSGGGQNYVHGGTSLQEMIIPVIAVKSIRAKKETEEAELIITSLSRKITNLITYMDFMQKEPVSDTVLPLTVKAHFTTEEGEKISNECIINANVKDEKPDKRAFKEKFVLKDRKYSKDDKYFMVLMNDKTDVEVARYEFIIDIAFSDDYGFGV